MSMPALFKGRLSLPVIGAPLFIISVPDLVIAQCKGGIRRGVSGAGTARPPALLDEWLVRIKQELAAHDKAHPDRPSAPFAGQSDRASVEQPARTGSGALREAQGADHHHLKLGAREELNQAAHGWGGIVFHDVINQTFAHKAVEKGADGLILGCLAGAGGHAGEDIAFRVRGRNPAMVRWADCTVGCDRQRPCDPLGGADAWRRLCLYRLGLHSHFRGQCGGRLQADDHHLDRREDIVYSNLFTGVHGNYLKPSDRRSRHGPGQPSGVRRVENEFRERCVRRARVKPKAWEGNLGQRPGRHGSVGKIVPAGEIDCAALKRNTTESVDPPL